MVLADTIFLNDVATAPVPFQFCIWVVPLATSICERLAPLNVTAGVVPSVILNFLLFTPAAAAVKVTPFPRVKFES
ncbi:MAG: hypothetical protein BWY37_02220 [Firmicutes bacterium ADurb.Bin262]|nr:MAG: hypothetical protein BWY37_02220 [Firmicutes bacterium ADurb.Bin262]